MLSHGVSNIDPKVTQLLGKRKSATDNDKHEQSLEKKQKTTHSVPLSPPPKRTYEGTWHGTKYLLTDEPAVDDKLVSFKRKVTLTYIDCDVKSEEKKQHILSFFYTDTMYKIRQKDKENYLKQQSEQKNTVADLPKHYQDWKGFDWQPFMTNKSLSRNWFLKMSEVQKLKQMRVEDAFDKTNAHLEDVVHFVCEMDPMYWHIVFLLTITTKHPQTGQESTFTSDGDMCNPMRVIPTVTCEPKSFIKLGDYHKWEKEAKVVV